MRRLTGRSIQIDWRNLVRRRRRGSSRRRLIIGGLVAVVAVLAVWALFDLRSARNDLNAARAELQAAASNLGTATDAQGAAELRKATKNAVDRTDAAYTKLRRAPLLRIGALLPPIKTQRDGVVRAARVARDAAVIGDRLTAAVEGLHDRLQVQNARVDLEALGTLARVAGDAGRDLGALPQTNRGGQWGPLRHATRDLDDVIRDTTHRLTTGARTMDVAHDLLGANGPRRIFIAIENNAEMRDTGMVLSYAVADTRDGQLQVTRSGSVSDLELDHEVADVTLPSGTEALFGSLLPRRYWQSVNATADTGLAGELMRSLYREKTGDRVDAVVGLDVPALASLLSATGPVSVNGIGEVNADNAADILLHRLYADADESEPGRIARQAKLAEVTTAIINRIQGSSINATALIRALGTSAAGGHTWVSSANPDFQQSLVAAGIGGGPGSVAPERTFHLSVQNGTATKLDWFIDPKVDVQVSLTEEGTAVVTTTVSLVNSAPNPAPTSEQFGPDGIVTSVAGVYKARVYLWSPLGSDAIASQPESGLLLNYAVAEVRGQETKSVTFSTVIQDAVKDNRLRLRFVPQARVRPASLKISVSGLGWKVASGGTRTLQWDRTVDVTWKLNQVK